MPADVYTLVYVGFKKNLLKKVQFHHLISFFFLVKHRLQAKRLLEIIQARNKIAFTVWLTLIIAFEYKMARAAVSDSYQHDAILRQQKVKG